MLDEVVLQSSVRELAFRDEDLARVIETYGATAPATYTDRLQPPENSLHASAGGALVRK
jgi:hypothetical protein